MSETGICIFCGAQGPLSDEHVLSNPILERLVGVTRDTSISWSDGSPELWGGEVGAETLDQLTIHCVCRDCNSRWMSDLDNRFAGDLEWWAANPRAKLGPQRVDTIKQYLLKLLWVVGAGERMAMPHWVTGDGPEPEFLPMSLRSDGGGILARTLDDLQMNVHVGVCSVHPRSTDLLTIIPVSADYIPDNNKARRTNGGLALTLRGVGLRFFCIATWLKEQLWQPRWPSPARSLRAVERSGRLPAMDELGSANLRLHHVGDPDPPPDPVAFVDLVLANAQAMLRDAD